MAKSIALLTLAALLTQGLPALAQFDTLVPLPTPIPSSTPSLDLDGPPILPRRSLPAPAKPQGPFRVPERLDKLRTATESSRQFIIEELSDPKRSIISELLVAFKTESDPLVKSALAKVLGNRWEESEPAIDDLIVMLRDQRRALVSADEDLPYRRPLPNEPIAPRLIIPFTELRELQLKRYPSPVPGNPTDLLRISAIEALGKIGLPAREKATRSLTTLLQDENPLVRVNAVWALLEVGANVPVLETWLSVLQSDEPRVRQVAARLDPQTENSLIRKALGSEATPKTIKILTELLGDSEENVRQTSRSSLRLFGNSEVIPDLILALESPKPLTRINATQFLGGLGTKALPATSALIKGLSDPGEYIPPPEPFGGTALRLSFLPSLLNEQARPIDDDFVVRPNAAIALGSIGSVEAIPALKIGLKDSYPQMRLACAWALIRLNQTESAIPVLAELLKNSNVDMQNDSIRILKTLGRPGAKYVLPLLLKRLDNAKPGEWERIMWSFHDLGGMVLPALSRLRQTLEGPDVAARGYAVTVLANVYEDLVSQNAKGKLAEADRTLATQELTKILTIVTKPGAKFTKTPIDRLRLVQTKL
jgi:HEAT repeat protein